MLLPWTNPRNVDVRPGASFLYFIRVVDPDSGREYTYVGQSRKGARRLGAYGRNVERIRKGLPRRTTTGQQRYRTVHLALAKAREQAWPCEFYPLENVEPELLNKRERECIVQLTCNLNAARSWSVADYAALTIADVLA